MAEHTMTLQRSASESSMIQVVTPRPSRSSVSSTFPLSQTSLVPQLRRTSESTTHPMFASTTTALPQTPISSIPSFRSIRNLLPFAPGRTSNAPSSPLHTPKPSFVSFGSLRRMTHDRKSSAAHPPLQEVDQPPVIAIARPSQTFEEEMMARKRSRDIDRSTTDLSPSSRKSDEHYVLPLPSAGPPLGADLSTIIEAETSGLSRHIPHLGDTTHAEGDDDTTTSPFNLEQIDKSRHPSPDSRAESVLNLSTSKLAAEVMHALKVEDATTGSEWLKGVDGIVVEEGVDELDAPPDAPPGVPINAVCGDEDLDATLDFGALDPDLAELLSPNRINGNSQSLNPVANRLPSTHPLSTSSLYPPNGNAARRTSPRLETIVPPSASRGVIQSSPTRRSASLSRANPPHGLPSSLPRLIRSVTAAPPSANDTSDGLSTVSGLLGASKKRHQPPSPLSPQTQSNSPIPSPASSHGSTDMLPRKLTSSRLATPHRHASSFTAGNTRLTDPTPALPPSTNHIEKSLCQLSSRSTSDPPHQPSSRPSLEINGALDVNKRRRPHLFNNRKRSMSVEETQLSPTPSSISLIRPSSSLSNRPPVMEWLGPRTVKAFAAAGLLDSDRDGPNMHLSGSSKYASLRAHNEREDRFVPSRMAFSEAASTSSWGRSGSVSRGMTPSDGGLTWGSPTFSGPRTTFSGSTAPTSVSASSSQQATIQLMKEKHDLETEALLSALSDSQRTTKTLREENLQLRDRIRQLEDELDEARTQIHRLASGPLSPRAPSSGTFPRSPRDRPVLLPSPLAPPRRPAILRSLSHAHTNGISVDPSPRSSRAASPCRDHSPVLVAAPQPRRRRASTTSSVFPSLPQNMSLLMHEEAMHDRPVLSSAPPSPPLPTCAIPRHSSLHNLNRYSGSGWFAPPSQSLHTHTHPSALVPGTGNISPTIASFSMTEVPGSPTSLQLRPEHELHLGDMTSLSLYAMSDEEL